MQPVSQQRIGQRIGLLGGSFNPPHAAHLALALAAQQQLVLDRVDVLPAGKAWQKRGAGVASAAHRLAMCELLVQDHAQLGVESCELTREGNTYSVQTLRELRSAHPDCSYVFILGADQVQRFDSWHDWQGVLQQCTLATAQRAEQSAQFPAVVQAHLDLHGMTVLRVELPPMRVSSSELRARLAKGEPPSGALPSAVARYISKHALYSAQSQTE